MHGGAAIGETGAAEESLQVAEYEEAAEVIDKGGGHGEDDEQGEGRDVDGVAADDGDFAEWSEEERTHAIWKVSLVSETYFGGWEVGTYRPERREIVEERLPPR